MLEACLELWSVSVTSLQKLIIVCTFEKEFCTKTMHWALLHPCHSKLVFISPLPNLLALFFSSVKSRNKHLSVLKFLAVLWCWHVCLKVAALSWEGDVKVVHSSWGREA